MPTSSELIDAQYEFELPRGLLDHNTGEFVLHRLSEELGEVWEEHDAQNYLRMLQELIDVVIFSHSIMGDLCRRLDIAYEEVDRMIEAKMLQNAQKYHISHFSNRSTAEAIEYSRQRWTSK